MALSSRARGVRPLVACGLLAGAVAFASRSVAAELPGAKLEVSRAPGAEACPDSDALAAELAPRVAPDAPPALPLSFTVELLRDGDDFVATVHVDGRKHGIRTLRAQGPACDALHDALLVTLLVLLDEDRKTPAPEPAPVAAPIAPRFEERVAPVEVQGRTSEGLRPSIWLSAGAGVTHGLPLRWSGAMLFDLSVRLDAFELSFGGFWAPPRGIPARPGSVTVNAFGERVRGCYALEPSQLRGARLLGCAVGVLSQLTGESFDFDNSHSEQRPWWLAGVSLEATYPISDRIDAGIAVSALGTLHPERFSVTGLTDPVYTTDSFVYIAAARLEARVF